MTLSGRLKKSNLSRIFDVTLLLYKQSSLQVNFCMDFLCRYIALHRELFGTYEGELMPRPSKEVLHRIRGTFTEFLVRNNLDSLIPIFTASQTIQGYGYLDEVAALYGLIWNTPKLLSNIAKRDSK